MRTVLDYYESFFKNPSLQLRLDIFRSMIYLANSLFDSKQQYESVMNKLNSHFDWLNSFVQLDLSGGGGGGLGLSGGDQLILNELIDESMLAVGIYAECLCRCCLQASKCYVFATSMSSKDFERLNRLFENGFKSNSVAVKIATVQGLMYWLESITLGYISNPLNPRLFF